MQQIQYLPGYPDNWRQEMEHKLDNHPNVEKWAYIPHDSDVDAYRAATQEYALIGSGPNPVAAMYADVTDDSEDDLKDFCRSLGIEYKPEGLPSDYVIQDEQKSLFK